eukprot:COSAG01_NODE_16187_length_1265_cov_1.053310_1_plen_52_part_10
MVALAKRALVYQIVSTPHSHGARVAAAAPQPALADAAFFPRRAAALLYVAHI